MNRTSALKRFCSLGGCCILLLGLQAQEKDSLFLLNNKQVEIRATAALDSMYNFNFRAASKRFYWLQQDHKSHPLPYFLFALSAWWLIIPNTSDQSYDDAFLRYVDTAIYTSKQLIKEGLRTEGAFFLSSAYAILGRFYGERGSFLKAAWAGKNALKYLKIAQEKKYVNVELLLGHALFNYFSAWLRETHPSLKPILSLFGKGDKQLGIRQLDHVAKHSFYARIEAQTFLMEILNKENTKETEALHIATYLHEKYPNNPYFHRFYARMLYNLNKYSACKLACESVIARVQASATGYEANSGRQCSFFLGWIHQVVRHELQAAKGYYIQTLRYAQKAKAARKGYTLRALLALGDIEAEEKHYDKAKSYYKKAISLSERGSKIRKSARSKQKNLRKKERKMLREARLKKKNNASK